MNRVSTASTGRYSSGSGGVDQPILVPRRDLVQGGDFRSDHCGEFSGDHDSERVIRDYGADYELIADPTSIAKPKRKNKRSHSRSTQRKREIAARAVRDYSTEDILQAARDFLREQNEEWVNVSRVMQHLYETFYELKPKHLAQPDKKYKSLLKFLEDYPSDFEVRADTEKRGLYWIRLAQKQRD